MNCSRCTEKQEYECVKNENKISLCVPLCICCNRTVTGCWSPNSVVCGCVCLSYHMCVWVCVCLSACCICSRTRFQARHNCYCVCVFVFVSVCDTTATAAGCAPSLPHPPKYCVSLFNCAPSNNNSHYSL